MEHPQAPRPPRPLRPDLLAAHLHSYDPQAACPLFARLPAEIRLQIFALVLTASDDTSRPYRTGAYYHRPGYRFPHLVDTAVLLTCRAIYLEAYLLPARQNELVWWGENGPLHAYTKVATHEGLKLGLNISRASMSWLRMSTQHRRLVRAHWFGSPQAFNRIPPESIAHYGFHPTTLHITVPAHQWPAWDGMPDDVDVLSRSLLPPTGRATPEPDPFAASEWSRMLPRVRGLEHFVLELEVLEPRAAELEQIVRQAAHWRFPPPAGPGPAPADAREQKELAFCPALTRRARWTGVNRFQECRAEDHHQYMLDTSATEARRLAEKEAQRKNRSSAAIRAAGDAAYAQKMASLRVEFARADEAEDAELRRHRQRVRRAAGDGVEFNRMFARYLASCGRSAGRVWQAVRSAEMREIRRATVHPVLDYYVVTLHWKAVGAEPALRRYRSMPLGRSRSLLG
jgi:hypothetical protein